jgi:uncharacterized protein (UPF0333 family)
MVKELFLAIFLGALLGFGITGGFFALNKNKNTTSAATQITPTISVSNEDKIKPTPTIDQNSSGKLTISTPVNNTIVSTSNITVTGITAPQSIVVITTPLKSYTTTAGAAGSFDVDIQLEGGANQIQVTAIDSQDEQTEVLLNITYSTAKI